jgi:hypothetical protein
MTTKVSDTPLKIENSMNNITPAQDDFDLTIGRLDRVLSKLVLWSHDGLLDIPNQQTLKHHAEDMIAAGEHMLKRLVTVKGTPQPEKE